MQQRLSLQNICPNYRRLKVNDDEQVADSSVRMQTAEDAPIDGTNIALLTSEERENRTMFYIRSFCPW